MGLVVLGCAESSQIIITFDKGKIEGTFNDDKTIRIFKGIPYAVICIGELRWQAPQPSPKWKGVKKANEFGERVLPSLEIVPYKSSLVSNCTCVRSFLIGGMVSIPKVE